MRQIVTPITELTTGQITRRLQLFIYSPQDFADIARNRRIALGLTQVQFAEAIGRSQTWVSAFESGRTVPLLDSVLLVARSLGLGLDCTDDPWSESSSS